jgi:hypothetical protein
MSRQITLPDFSLSSLSGYKTYIALAVGAIVIAANHFGFLPPDYAPAGLDPNNWVNDEYKLILGAFARSALAKVGPTAGIAVQQATTGQPVTGTPVARIVPAAPGPSQTTQP